MAQNAEANILITIKEKGKEALDGIESGMASIVKIGAAMAATLIAVGASIGKLAGDASQFEEIKSGFERLAVSQGANADKILEKMRQASDGVLSTSQIMKAANEAMLAGIPIDRLGKITEIAKAAANTTGDTVENMMNVITNGLARTSTMMLRHLGIVFDENEAYKNYAKSIGKTIEELTDNEKKQVFLNKALEVGQKTLDKLGPSQISVSDQWDRLKATMANNEIILGQKLIPSFRVMLNLLEDLELGFKNITKGSGVFNIIAMAASETLTMFQKIGDFFQGIVEGFIGMGFVIKNFIQGDIKTAQSIIEQWKKDAADRSVLIEKKAQERITALLFEETKRREKTTAEIYEENAKKERDLAKTREELKSREIIDIRKQWEDKYVQTDFQTFSEQLDIKKQMEARALDERIRQRELSAQKEKEYMQRFVEGVQTFTSQGLQGLTSKMLVYLTDTFIPGAGAAVSSVFDLLSQSTDQFKETLNKLFGPEFIENVLKNLTTLIEELPAILDRIIAYLSENMPAIVENLVTAIIANLPEITAAWIKVFTQMLGNPKFIADLGAAIAKGFIAGIKDAAGDITEAIKKAIRDAVSGGGADLIAKGVKGVEKTLGGLNSVLPGGGFSFYHGGPIPAYAGGGLIDDKLIRASAGEYMINRDSASANMGLLDAINNSNGRAVSGGNNIVINVNGGLLGDRQSAEQFARAIDEELYKLRRGNASRAFDRSIY